MAISFIRIDDRIIHGQTVTRWANEYPCTGLIGVNDAAAGNKLLVSAFKGASSKKTFVWNIEHFKKNADKVLASKDQYFLITKNSVDMAELLVDFKFATPIKKVIVGPCPDRPGAVKLGNNQSITQDEAEAFDSKDNRSRKERANERFNLASYIIWNFRLPGIFAWYAWNCCWKLYIRSSISWRSDLRTDHG